MVNATRHGTVGAAARAVPAVPVPLVVLVAAMATAAAPAAEFDPYASSNGLYPGRDEYTDAFRVGNTDYDVPPAAANRSEAFVRTGPIDLATAPAWLDALKTHLSPTLAQLVNDGASWDPRTAGWYDMIWLGQGSLRADGTTDPTSGREAISNTYTGQIVPASAFVNRFDPERQGPLPRTSVQNHAVIYYNGIAATMLGALWEDPYAPDLAAIDFPDGSISVKVEAVTTDATDWSVVRDAGTWQVYRPSVQDQLHPPVGGAIPEVRTVYPLQMSIAVKDTVASPQTGWVYAAFVYDADAAGTRPWDRFVPVGAMWGNDPDLAREPDGNGGSPANLTETWFDERAPHFVHGTRGWGGRLAGPMDVATRSNVLSTAGGNATPSRHDRGTSSCLSCHTAAEFPWTRNLYPAPVRAFPRDGEPFVLFEPGSERWARWFRNPPGSVGVSGKRVPRGLDYDFAIMFALGVHSGAIGNPALSFERFDVH